MFESEEKTKAVAWLLGLYPEDIEVRMVQRHDSSDPSHYEVILLKGRMRSTYDLDQLVRTHQALMQMTEFLDSLPHNLPSDVAKHLEAARDAMESKRYLIKPRQ